MGKHKGRKPNTLEARSAAEVKEYFPKSKADFYLGVGVFGRKGLGRSPMLMPEVKRNCNIKRFPGTKTTDLSLLQSILHITMSNSLKIQI